MNYFSVSEIARRWVVSERTVRNWCAVGKIKGAFLTGKTWNIPEDAVRPRRGKEKPHSDNPLLNILKEQKDMQLRGGIYHRVQIELTYNSNHIEGSRLTQEQTRHIFETNTLGVTDQAVNVDDVIETSNHFRCIDLVIDKAASGRLTEAFVKELHRILKAGTSDSRRTWFRVGEYKKLPNEVGGQETTPPEQVAAQMKALLSHYNALTNKTLEDIVAFHHAFECIHPFQDGNGRVGRLIMFKELLRIDALPVLVHDAYRAEYVNGISKFPDEPGWLVDTLLFERDLYRSHVLKTDAEALRYTYHDQWNMAEHRVERDEDLEFAKLIDTKAQPLFDEEYQQRERLLWGE